MLKIIGSLNEPAFSRNDGSRSASSRNNNSRLASKKNDGDGEVDEFGVGENGVKHAKKSGKLSMSRKLLKSKKSKNEKMSKFWNLAKSGKKLSKSGNSTNFNATKVEPKFLTPDAKTAFNRLRLAFTEAPILRYFDLEYHIWIETDASSYAIDGVLSQLTSGTNPDGIVTKADLSQ